MTRKKAFTAEDARNSKLIAVLLMAAKLLDSAGSDMRLDADVAAERASNGYFSLMSTSLRMFPIRGEMEREVLAFARSIGFEVEQQQISPGSKAKN